jgi:hypothetical protein
MGLCLCRESKSSAEYIKIRNKIQFINIADYSLSETIINDINNYDWKNISPTYYSKLKQNAINIAKDAFNDPVYESNPREYLRQFKTRKYITPCENVMIEIFSKHIK